MNIAWYGHLKFKNSHIAFVIIVSWGIAFFEYCLQIPANRIGHQVMTAPQLKAVQEVLSFSIFFVFSSYYLNEKPSIYDLLAFGLITLGVCVSLFQPSR
jgi:hypothetical protein